jgi:hypothetical protein
MIDVVGMVVVKKIDARLFLVELDGGEDGSVEVGIWEQE